MNSQAQAQTVVVKPKKISKKSKKSATASATATASSASSASASSVSTNLGTSVGLGLMTLIGITVLYLFKNTIGFYFNILYWLVFPISVYLVSVGLNVLNQKTNGCASINMGSIFTSALYTLGFLYAAMAVIGTSSLPYIGIIGTFFKAPVISLFIRDPTVTTIEAAEQENPVYTGIGAGYWACFGVITGQLISGGVSQLC